MKKTIIFLSLLLLSGCAAQQTVVEPDVLVDQEPEVYTSETWKELIADDCQSFYDGCNTCNRSEGSDMFACTLRYCDTYEKPYCLDDEEQVDGTVVYNMDSWKEIIPEDCQSFSNGCNNCFRVEGTDDAACDRRMCESFTKPVCLDEE